MDFDHPMEFHTFASGYQKKERSAKREYLPIFSEQDIAKLKEVAYRLKFKSNSEYFKPVFLKAYEMITMISESSNAEAQQVEFEKWKSWISELNVNIVDFLCIVADDVELCARLFNV